MSSLSPFFDFSSFELDVFYISHPRSAQSSSKRRPLDILAVTGKAITRGLVRDFFQRVRLFSIGTVPDTPIFCISERCEDFLSQN